MQAHMCACMFNMCKTSKNAYAHTVTCDFGVRTWNSEYTQHMRDAHHEFALGLPHYSCS